jgi:transglutaminase-like putative cysteine protease
MNDRFSPFLAATRIVNTDDPAIAQLARTLAGTASSDGDVARACFEWVRDHIAHSGDARHDHVTCGATDVLRTRTGYCYAKSHLLAALLRANHLPAGFVYQRLALDESGQAFCLHGLNAVWLKEYGWYRLDARGNRPGVTTAFDPPREQLAFTPSLDGERTIGGIAATPLPVVISALETFRTRDALEAHLPDLDIVDVHELGDLVIG